MQILSYVFKREIRFKQKTEIFTIVELHLHLITMKEQAPLIYKFERILLSE